MYRTYSVLMKFVFLNGSIEQPGDKLNFDEGSYSYNKNFLDALCLHGFIEEIKDASPSFGVIATSKLAGVEIADRDYTEGEKEYFTFDEALEVENNLKDGWRLPTRHEWALISEEFANDDNDHLSSKLIMQKLHLVKNGYIDEHGNVWEENLTSNYWSRSAYTLSDFAHYFSFDSSTVFPSDYGDKCCGFSLRCVRDLHGEDNNGEPRHGEDNNGEPRVIGESMTSAEIEHIAYVVESGRLPELPNDVKKEVKLGGSVTRELGLFGG